jgi:hypothetical protein
MSTIEMLILFFAAFAGGALNSIAGGGSFIAFPALLFTGVPPIPANATNTVALWPGSIAGASAYRSKLGQIRQYLVPLTIVSVIGGYLGALLLLNTDERTFEQLVPWLLLFAASVFAFGGNITTWLRRGRPAPAVATPVKLNVTSLIIQFLISIYGGYFGGGIGFMMLAALTLAGMTDIHTMNGLKNLLATAINGSAVVAFVIAGAVYWPQALVMIAGAIIGGYSIGLLAQRLDPKQIRRFVIIMAFVITVYFFYRTYAV